MRCTAILAIVALVFAAALTSQAHAQQAGVEFNARVQATIDKTVAFLWSQQRPDGSWPPYEGHEDKKGGQTSLVAYALLESGVSPLDPNMLKAINYLGNLREGVRTTYGLGLRANVWYVANRSTADKYLGPLRSDAGRLGRMGARGRYHYAPEGTANGSWDNSNSQYGVLGMWAAAQNGMTIPARYWQLVKEHWTTQQNGDGGWGYYDGAPHVQAADGSFYYGNATQPTMSVGGLATLYICEDNLPASQAIISCNNVQPDPAITRALNWMHQNFARTVTQPGFTLQSWYFYYLYGVERAALASGYKYFGGQDWYRVGTAMLQQQQAGNGSYYLQGALDDNGPQAGEVVSSSAFALLFMIRGQQPLLFNKLQFSGDWDNRPRDLAAACRWINKEFESNVNWQIVNLGMTVEEWRDAPIMYISAHQALPVGPGVIVPGAAAPDPASGTFSDENLAKLRTYVHRGGMILTVNEANNPQFTQSVKTLYQRLFPEYAMTECGPDHPIYTCNTNLQPGQVKFYVVSNGIRPLAIHVDTDLSLRWQQRHWDEHPYAFEALRSIVTYGLNGVSWLPPRNTSVWPLWPPVPGLGQSALAGGFGAPAGGGGGAPAGGGGQQQPVDLIYIILNGAPYVVGGDAAGQRVDLGGQVVTVPDPYAADRVIVLNSDDNTRVSIPREYVGYTFPTPSGGQFVADQVVGGNAPANNGGGNAPAPQPGPAGPGPGNVPAAGGTATIVRLQYNGNWNPEPLAYERFTYLMGAQASTTVQVLGPVPIAQLTNQAKLAILTGTDPVTFTDAEVQALKAFVENGGTLFIDFAGGSRPPAVEGGSTFDTSVAALVDSMFDGKILKPLSHSSPIYSIPNAVIDEVTYRMRTQLEIGESAPQLKAVLFDDRPGIIYSKYDITGGLVGYESFPVNGYSVESAFAMLRNIVLYAGR
ncbi:MAG: DUF4159 domain-containing protein [Planctomycetota bacterium]|jgi:hypothetical protein